MGICRDGVTTGSDEMNRRWMNVYSSARLRRWLTSGLCQLAALLLQACGGDGADSADEDPSAHTLGGLHVRVVAAPPGVEVRADADAQLLTRLMLADGGEGATLRGLAFGVGVADIKMRYGSYHFEEKPTEWRAVAKLTKVSKAKDGMSFELLAADGSLLGAGKLSGLPGGGVALDVEGPATANRASIALPCAEAEHFLGLGGQSYDVDHRGWTVPLWVAEDGLGKKADDVHTGDWQLIGRRHSTHTPIPLTLSSRNYALLLDTPAFARFALCSEQQDAVRLEAFEGRLKVRVFHAPTPLQVLQQTSAAVGRPRMPPNWTFGLWVDAMHGSENVRRIATALRAAGVAVTALWSEDWRGGKAHGDGYTLDEDWTLDTDLYPDATQLVTDLRANGMVWLTYNNTFLSESSNVYAKTLQEGLCIHREKTDGTLEPYLFDGVKFEKSSLLDLRNPAALAFAKTTYEQSLQLGAVGWMADFCEWLPPDAVLHDGADPLLAHNLYPVEFQQLHRSLFDAWEKAKASTAPAGTPSQLQVFVRAAWLGSQSLVTVVWAGDQQTDFSLGDGYPSVIPMGIGLGIAGFPFFAHDIGGYMSTFTEPTTKELWYRWVTLGAMTPVMRTHHGRAAYANWNWEKDAETTAHFARWSRLHMQLFPYLHALAAAAVQTGAPMLRPLSLHWPTFEPGWSATDLWLLGDRVVVAPVIEKGKTMRALTLPAGRWYGLLDGDVHNSDGKTPLQLTLPITEIGALVPAGTVLALLPEAVRTTEAVAASGVVDLDDVGDDREIWLFRGPGPQAGAVPVDLEVGSFAEAKRHDSAAPPLQLRWQAGALADWPSAATWQGADGPAKSVQAVGGAFEVVGSGTLTIGVGKLTVKGGGQGKRRVVLR